MDSLITYSLPISGMGDGHHQFDFQIDSDFFAEFKESAFQEGDLQVRLDFEKFPSFFVLDFHLGGTVRTACDRCLEQFDLPLDADHSLKVKFDEEEREEAEVIYINRDRQEFNVASYIYEFIHLSVPLMRTHDLVDEDCDPAIFDYLDPGDPPPAEEADEKPSPWDALKNLRVK